jgi:alpha-1,2-mannosyltransferase
MVLAWEALAQVIPDLYIGVLASFRCYQMTDPRAAQTARAMLSHSMSWRGSLRALPTGAYMHYPTISTDMLARMKAREAGHTNRGDAAGSVVLSIGKVL